MTLLLHAVVFLPRQYKGWDLPGQLPVCNRNPWWKRAILTALFLFRKVRKSCFY